MEQKPIKIAFVGCLHGKLSDIYKEIKQKEKNDQINIDLVICCGDFQSVRTEEDLQYMSVPDKYKEMGQFYLYYTGQKRAPYLTLFIGGNHEASNVLDEYHYGGYLCHNIFFLGRAGVVKFKGLKIGGLSGIYKDYDYFKGHHEINLLKHKKNVYHNREFEIAKLNQITEKIDILVSHDWPNSIVKPKDFAQICKVKRHFRKDLENNELGSPATQYLLELLKPRHWVCAHMHYCYQTMISHEDGTYTQFTALDKIIKNRTYLFFADIFINDLTIINDNNIYFDIEWLAITKIFNDYTVFENKNYDFSSFIKNNDLYFKFVKKTYDSKTLVVKDDDFDHKLSSYKKDFDEKFKKETMIWVYKSPKDYRDYIINVLGIDDSFKNKVVKRKLIINNKEELKIEWDI